MIFSAFILLNIIGVFLFIITKKNLHILEILVYWLISSYLFQNLSALCYMNFNTLMIPEKLSYELSHFLNRTVIYPIFMVTFLHYFLILKSIIQKLLLFIYFISVLVGMEYIEHFSGVLIHVHWKVWWSFTFWLAALLVLIGFMKYFRRILYKGESKL
jgi:hypothetical protein